MNEEREKHRRELAMIKSESEISRLEELRNHERVLQSQEETGKEKLRESLSQRRAQIQVDAADWAKNLTNVATGLLVLATFLACFVIAPLIRQYYSEIEPYELVIQIFLAAITLIGIRVNAFSIRSHINEFLFRKIHNIKLSASGLEQLEYELGIAHLERKELFEDFRE